MVLIFQHETPLASQSVNSVLKRNANNNKRVASASELVIRMCFMEGLHYTKHEETVMVIISTLWIKRQKITSNVFFLQFFLIMMEKVKKRFRVRFLRTFRQLWCDYSLTALTE